MELKELLKLLVEQNNNGGGYQVHLNSGNLEDICKRNTCVEFSDLYFMDCSVIENTTLLSFGNMSRNPIDQKEDGESLYPSEINSSLFIDMSKVEAIEELKDFRDWFSIPSTKVINIYIFPENNNFDGNRNVVTIGFM